MPGLRGVLFVFAGLAAVLYGEDAELRRIPAFLVDDNHGRMRCEGNRCTALIGEVGMSTSCSIYALRPQVCRVCLPGDEACQEARRLFGL
jgi:uncharacterized protein